MSLCLTSTALFNHFPILCMVDLTICRISSTGASAPFPWSPHASVFTIGSITMTLSGSTANFWIVVNCSCVNLWFHMAVFIAGANINGLSKSHARTTELTTSSHRPPRNLANECADSGATSIISAQFLKSMCMTGSPKVRHCLHSSDESVWKWFEIF